MYFVTTFGQELGFDSKILCTNAPLKTLSPLELEVLCEEQQWDDSLQSILVISRLVYLSSMIRFGV